MTRRRPAPIVVTLLVAVLAVAGCGDAGSDVPPLHAEVDGLDETVVTLTTADGEQVRVDAKVAATSAQQQRGLMRVPNLPAGTGMLFVFDTDRSGGFWMWETLVPLDIAFAAADGTIHTILAMDPCEATDPDDCPTYRPERPYRTALEVPQGWLADQGVTEGDRLTWADPVRPSSP